MSSVVLSGNDSIILDGTILADFADGDVAIIEFPNDLAATSTGKNGNTIVGENKKGLNGDLTLRVLRGSADDKRLNTRLAQQLNNFSGFVMVQGTFTKYLGDGKGKVKSDTYAASYGTFLRQPDVKSNVDGNTDQSVTVWKIKFGEIRRVIG